MKAILMSIRPQHVANILNGLKTIEIRKKFPKYYVGWVYIYCCAEDKNGYLIRNRSTKKMEYTYNGFVASICWLANRKVVARFWCDKVENLYEYQIDGYGSDYEIASDTLKQEELLKECCLTYEQLNDYLGDINNGYAIHITELEIFYKPKELSEFSIKVFPHRKDNLMTRYLTRAPQSYCFIEV